MSTGVKAIRRMFDAFASGDVSGAEEYIHDDYLNPDSLERSAARGPEGFAGNVKWLHNAFSDLKFSELEISEGGGFVLARVIMSGQHTGELVGFPPTGRAFYAEQLHLCRILEGKIAQHRDWRDDLGVLRQLGLPRLGD
jgi:nogalonic acid methyl ester cyclase / aklanonic acid methyl ester cyclase